jgi:beta-glucanase (GH16 family)
MSRLTERRRNGRAVLQALQPLAALLLAASGCGVHDDVGAAPATRGASEDASGPPPGKGNGEDAGAGSAGNADAPDAAGVFDGQAPDAVAADGGYGRVDAGGPGAERCGNRSPVDAGWKLVWSDEFEKDGAPDPSNWGFERGFVRNQELQWYQPDNASVQGGLLTIGAQRQAVPNPDYDAGSSDWRFNRQYAQYTSSSMTTAGKRSFTYGRFEMCGQIDTRPGSWPAFWILGTGTPWPQSGEVDIMEYYASGVRANVCKPAGGTCDWSGSVRQSLASLGTNWSSAFHLWAMEWDSQTINLYLDDKLVYPFKVPGAVASGANPYVGHPFYILVNLAIGASGGDPSTTTFPIEYRVDYVRVYQH